jgi:hypothetical protein
MALSVEVIVDGSVHGVELLQCLHPSEAQHGPLSSSQRLVRILGSAVQPAAFAGLPSGETPENLHTGRSVAPISGEHLV